MPEQDWTTYIRCPHCHETSEETYDYPDSLRRDGDSAEMECGYCGKEMRVELCITYEYRASVPTLAPSPPESK